MDLQTLLVSLIVAGVSGLTFLAYKHPNAFKKIFDFILPFIVFAPIILFTKEATKIYLNTKSLVDELAENASQTLKDETYAITSLNEGIDSLIFYFILWAVIAGYLYFLYKLPSLLETKNEKET